MSANYLTSASGVYSGNGLAPVTASSVYQVNKKYKVMTKLNIRKGPGIEYARVKRSKLSNGMKKKVYKRKYAVLKKGKKIKCKEVRGNWMRIPGGWVCAYEGNSIYVK